VLICGLDIRCTTVVAAYASNVSVEEVLPIRGTSDAVPAQVSRSDALKSCAAAWELVVHSDAVLVSRDACCAWRGDGCSWDDESGTDSWSHMIVFYECKKILQKDNGECDHQWQGTHAGLVLLCAEDLVAFRPECACPAAVGLPQAACACLLTVLATKSM
jgi:hypothetical protein